MLRSLIRLDWRQLSFATVLSFYPFEGNWACLLATGSHRYRGRSAQRTALAAELADRRKENEEEREVKAQGPRSRCRALTEEAKTLCFLQFLAVFKLVRAKSPWGRPARIALDFLSAESSSCLLAKAVEPDWILWRLLRYSKTFWRVLLEEWRGFDWRLTGWSRTWNSAKKIQSPYPSPISIFLFFFLSKDWWKTKRNPSKPKVVYLKKYRFHARKVEDSEHAIYVYVREFSAAWPNPDLRPFAGRPPVKSKCMGFAGYFARCDIFQQTPLSEREAIVYAFLKLLGVPDTFFNIHLDFFSPGYMIFSFLFYFSQMMSQKLTSLSRREVSLVEQIGEEQVCFLTSTFCLLCGQLRNWGSIPETSLNILEFRKFYGRLQIP